MNATHLIFLGLFLAAGADGRGTDLARRPLVDGAGDTRLICWVVGVRNRATPLATTWRSASEGPRID